MFNLKPKDQTRERAFAGCRMSVKTAVDNTVFGIEVSGNEQEKVRYSWKTEEGPVNTEIEWKDRYNQNVINAVIPKGVDASLSFAKTIGLERESYKDKDGQEKQRVVRKQLTGFDAVHELKKAIDSGNLTDETSVYISGNVKPNSFLKTNETTGETSLQKSIKLEAGTVTLTSPIVFGEMTEDDVKKAAVFNMDVVIKEFNEIDDVIYLTGIYVGYDAIEEMEFKFANPALAKKFQDTFSPHLKKGIYPMIKCEGIIKREVVEEEVTVEDDGWGERVVKRRNAPSKQVWLITFGDPETIDTESFTVENVDAAKEQIKAWKDDYKAGRDLRNEETTSTESNSGWGEKTSTEISMNDFDEDEDWD